MELVLHDWERSGKPFTQRRRIAPTFDVASRVGAAKRSWQRAENMPADLLDAEVMLNEQDIECRAPVWLVGRPDQVFLVPSKTLVIVDTKRREAPIITWSDVVQISAYGVILRHSDDRGLTRYPVDRFGFVRLVSSGEDVTYHRIELLPETVIIELYHLYLE